MFSPLEFQYGARILQVEESEFLVELRTGIQSTVIRLPKNFFPQETQPGDELVLRLFSKEAAQKGETAILKELLEELLK